MPIDFRVGGVDCRISCHWLNFSISGIKDWDESWDRFLPSYKIGNATQFYKVSYQYDISGMFLRRKVRPGCKNYPVEIELPGSFFDEGYDLDALFSEIYKAGGLIKISHCDAALDWFSSVDEYLPSIAPNQTQLQKTYNPHYTYPNHEWTGFSVGNPHGNRYWTVYNRVAKYGEDGHFQGRDDWWRLEIKIARKYAWSAFPEGHWTMTDIERVCAMALKDRNTVNCGFFHDLADKSLDGSIVLRQRKTVSFEAARDKLLIDMRSRWKTFRRKFDLNGEDEDTLQVVSDIERRLVDVWRFESRMGSKAMSPYAGSSSGVAVLPHETVLGPGLKVSDFVVPVALRGVKKPRRKRKG